MITKNYLIQVDENGGEDDLTYGGFITVLSGDSRSSIDFQYDNDHKIMNESPDSDNEDFNDNARWLAKTMLEIMKMESKDSNAHCDWSADIDHCPQTGKYKFEVEITKVGENK